MNRGWVMLALAAAACSDELPPEGHVLLHIATDAPVPALFDRLRVEIIPRGQDTPCAGCSRDFSAASAAASIVIVPESEGARVRVRYYRHGGTAASEPRPASSLEEVMALPPVPAEGPLELTVILRAEDVARPVGTLADPVEPEPGAPPPDLPGSWAGAVEVPCPGEPTPDEVCVPGGAFWMGDPRIDLSAAEDLDGELERLVVLAPFYLDAHEVTVASFRDSGLAVSLTPGGPSDDPHETDTGIADCTYTSAPGSSDDLPTNCITWERADAYCSAQGKSLPTEAQLELAAGARRARRYPWGEDEPRCPDAVFARRDTCSSIGGGPSPAGTGLRDQVRFGGEPIVDLAGNVSEWAADRWNREHEPCWGTGLFHDPLCAQPSGIDADGRSFRGGSFDSDPISLRAAVRSRVFNEAQAVSAMVGFRCARSAVVR